MSYSLSIITAARDINMGCWIHRYVFPRNSNLCVNSLILLFKVCIIASSYLLSRFWYCCDYLLKRLPGQTGQPVMKQFQANPVLWSMSGCLRNSLARFWIISGTLIKCVCVCGVLFFISPQIREWDLSCVVWLIEFDGKLGFCAEVSGAGLETLEWRGQTESQIQRRGAKMFYYNCSVIFLHGSSLFKTLQTVSKAAV